jgi:TPR repeat protein
MPQNCKEAVKWYQKVAEQGDTDAQCLLGLCYINGDGIRNDVARAYQWFKRAEKQSDEEAMELSLMSPEQFREVNRRYRSVYMLDVLKSQG